MSTLRTDSLQTTDSSFTIPVSSLASNTNTVRVVATVTELKAITDPLLKGVFLTSVGQGYYYDTSDTTSLNDDVLVVVGVTGMRWKLGLGATVSVKLFGAKGDGVTDDYSSILKAHQSGRTISYPAGTYLCGQKVVISGKFGLKGEGANLSFISFNGLTQGFDITQPTADDGFMVDNVTFLTNDTGNSFYGLRINGLPQMSGVNDGFRNILGNRNKYRGKVSNVVFSGTSNSSGWQVGLNLEAVMNCEVHNLTYTGVVPSVVGNLTGIGLLINGDGAATDIRIHGLWVFYALYAILAPDYVEGLHVYDYEFVVVTYGITARYTAGYSKLPSPSTGCLGFYLDQGHVNCLQAGLILDNANGMFITKQNIYMQPRTADAASRGIQISNGNDHRVRDIYISGNDAQNIKSSNYGVLLVGVGLSFVDSVTVSSVLSGVHLQGSSFNEIMNIQSRASVNVVSSDTGATQNSVGPGRASSNTGVKFSVPFNNTLRLDEFVTSSVIALTGGTSQTVSVTLPSGTFSAAPLVGSMVASSNSSALGVQYLYDSSSANTAVFYVYPLSPATNLPSAGIRFGINLTGL